MDKFLASPTQGTVDTGSARVLQPEILAEFAEREAIDAFVFSRTQRSFIPDDPGAMFIMKMDMEDRGREHGRAVRRANDHQTDGSSIQAPVLSTHSSIFEIEAGRLLSCQYTIRPARVQRSSAPAPATLKFVDSVGQLQRPQHILKYDPETGKLFACIPIAPWWPDPKKCHFCRPCPQLPRYPRQLVYLGRRPDRWVGKKLCYFHEQYLATGEVLTVLEQAAIMKVEKKWAIAKTEGKGSGTDTKRPDRLSIEGMRLLLKTFRHRLGYMILVSTSDEVLPEDCPPAGRFGAIGQEMKAAGNLETGY